MSSVIQLLDNNLIDQIAAGEVIERPVSVVKELVENSLDAGAGEIIIEIEEGGKKLIKIADNGRGMSADDLPMAIKRHATSKIRTNEDLFKISTLGFRGEALPSIASVSKMTIISKHTESTEAHGYKMTMVGSDIAALEKCAFAAGTAIEVRDLFYNIPARLKFLKSDNVEAGQIQNYLSRLMLSRPDVSYTYINNGKVVLQTQGMVLSPELSLKNAMAEIFGREVAKNLIKIDLELEDISVSGYISDPAKTASSRNNQIFFVNNRSIFSPLINKAVDTAVSDIVAKGRYPYLVLFIDVDYALVDVNVHPAKREVRFAEGGKVFDVIRSAIANTYRRQDYFKANDFSSLTMAVPELKKNYVPPINAGLEFTPRGERIIESIHNISQAFSKPFAGEEKKIENDNGTVRELSFEQKEISFSDRFSSLQIMGQVYRTYIVLADGDELLLVDQHAAHERILYEEISVIYGGQKVVQDLLLPEKIEPGQLLLAVLNENNELFKKVGFAWEINGDNVSLKSVPVLTFQRKASQIIFKELLEALSDNNNSELLLSAPQEKLFAVLACKAAIKAGDLLDIKEQEQLIKTLFATPGWQTCPHGRPTVSVFSRKELDQRFKRL